MSPTCSTRKSNRNLVTCALIMLHGRNYMSIIIPADKAHLLAESMSEKQLENHIDALAFSLGIVPLKIPDHVMKLLPPEWKGWPDRLFIGGSGIMWAELKSQTGRASREQLAFGRRLKHMGEEWELWRPSDLIDETIAQQLEEIA